MKAEYYYQVASAMLRARETENDGSNVEIAAWREAAELAAQYLRDVRERFVGALNTACDDIVEQVGLPDHGARDALNLLVNATLEYLDNPDADLESVAESCYEINARELRGGRTKLDAIADWINS